MKRHVDSKLAVRKEIVKILDAVLNEKFDIVGGNVETKNLSLSPLSNRGRSQLKTKINKIISTELINYSKGTEKLATKELAKKTSTQESVASSKSVVVVSSPKCLDPRAVNREKAPPRREDRMSQSHTNKISVKQEPSSEAGQNTPSDRKPSGLLKSKVDTVSSADDSRESFSSASFSSDSEIEGKVSLDVLKNSTQGNQAVKGTNTQMDEKADLSRVNLILRDARFFIMKSNNEDNIELSKSRSVWSTPPANESRINVAVRETRNVILIFSVKESGKFSGFARLAGESIRGGQSVNWILPPGLTQRALGGVFQLDWISMHDLVFSKCQHLFNPWNESKPVKIGRDGQVKAESLFVVTEVEPHVASELCRLFPPDTNADWNQIICRSKDAYKRIKSTRIVAPIGGTLPPTHFSSGFRDNTRREQRGRFNQTSPSVPRHTRSSYDSVRTEMTTNKRRYLENDYGSKRGRGSYETYYGDRRTEDLRPAPRYTHSQSQERNYESSDRRGYSNYHNSRTRDSYHRPPPPPMPYPPPPPFDSLPPPPRYYDLPPLPDYPTLAQSSSRGQRTNPKFSSEFSDPNEEEKKDRRRRRDREYERRHQHHRR